MNHNIISIIYWLLTHFRISIFWKSIVKDNRTPWEWMFYSQVYYTRVCRKLKKRDQTKSKKSENLRHQTLSNVRASCKFSAKNNIWGALIEKNKINVQSFVHFLSIDILFYFCGSSSDVIFGWFFLQESLVSFMSQIFNFLDLVWSCFFSFLQTRV